MFAADERFFFAPLPAWLLSLLVSGYASGCAVAAWRYFLKKFTPSQKRIKSCADMLIYSNIIMVAINMVAINLSVKIGLALAMYCLVIGMLYHPRYGLGQF